MSGGLKGSPRAGRVYLLIAVMMKPLDRKGLLFNVEEMQPLAGESLLFTIVLADTKPY